MPRQSGFQHKHGNRITEGTQGMITYILYMRYKRYKERKARHIAEVYQSEIHPEEYLRREREIRRENRKELVYLLILVIYAALALELWYAYEGFAVQW